MYYNHEEVDKMKEQKLNLELSNNVDIVHLMCAIENIKGVHRASREYA